MSTEKVFSNRERVSEALLSARKKWGDRSTTFEDMNRIREVLCFCFLYCPEDMRTLVESHLMELEIRIPYALMRIGD